MGGWWEGWGGWGDCVKTIALITIAVSVMVSVMPMLPNY